MVSWLEVITNFHFYLCPPASNTPYVPLLSWRKAQECVPWNIILLLGGGFAMAKGCEVPHYLNFGLIYKLELDITWLKVQIVINA